MSYTIGENDLKYQAKKHFNVKILLALICFVCLCGSDGEAKKNDEERQAALKSKPADEGQGSQTNIDHVLATAQETIKDKKKCQELPLELKSTFDAVKKNVKKGDKSYNKAAKIVVDLDNCRQLTLRYLDKIAEDLEIKFRIDVAKGFKETFIKNGIDIEVTLIGPKKEHIIVKSDIVDKTFIDKINDPNKHPEFLEMFKKTSFTKLTLTNSANDVWNYEIEPAPDRSGFVYTMISSLQAPFVLD